MEMSSSAAGGPNEISLVAQKCDGGTRCVVVVADTDAWEGTIAGIVARVGTMVG